MADRVFDRASICFQIAKQARDLGGDVVAAKRRVLKTVGVRMAKARLRQNMIMGAKKLNVKAALILNRIGFTPQATWHNSIAGMAPSNVSTMRALMSATLACGGPARCTTIAIGLYCGHSKDPGVALVLELITNWIHIWAMLDHGPTTRA